MRTIWFHVLVSCLRVLSSFRNTYRWVLASYWFPALISALTLRFEICRFAALRNRIKLPSFLLFITLDRWKVLLRILQTWTVWHIVVLQIALIILILSCFARNHVAIALLSLVQSWSPVWFVGSSGRSHRILLLMIYWLLGCVHRGTRWIIGLHGSRSSYSFHHIRSCLRLCKDSAAADLAAAGGLGLVLARDDWRTISSFRTSFGEIRRINWTLAVLGRSDWLRLLLRSVI